MFNEQTVLYCVVPSSQLVHICKSGLQAVTDQIQLYASKQEARNKHTGDMLLQIDVQKVKSLGIKLRKISKTSWGAQHIPSSCIYAKIM